MPIFIEEVITEVNASVTPPEDRQSLQQQTPAATAEQELLQTLAMIRQRQDRLRID